MRLLRKLIFKATPIIIIIGVVLFISNCFRAIIPSSSMYPLLEKGDQLLIWETDVSKLERGDVIVFYKDCNYYTKC